MDCSDEYILLLKIETDGVAQRICSSAEKTVGGDYRFRKDETQYTVRIDDGKLFVYSEGEITYSLHLQIGHDRETIIGTPYGEMKATINVSHLKTVLGLHQVQAECEYSLLFSGYEQKHRIEISVKKKQSVIENH